MPLAANLGASLLVLLAAVVTPAAQADGALPPPQYSIRQSVPDTGTRIPGKLVQGSAIALNRSDSQLTGEEQQLVKLQYEAMRPLDEPPFPQGGLRPIHESIAEIQRRQRTDADQVQAGRVPRRALQNVVFTASDLPGGTPIPYI